MLTPAAASISFEPSRIDRRCWCFKALSFSHGRLGMGRLVRFVCRLNGCCYRRGEGLRLVRRREISVRRIEQRDSWFAGSVFPDSPGWHLTTRSNRSNSGVNVAPESGASWSAFLLPNILDASPLVRILTQPAGLITNPLTEVRGSISGRGELKVADDASLINEVEWPVHRRTALASPWEV